MTPDDFDFHLPSDLIALRPAVPRDSARLLVVRAAGGDTQLEDRLVRDLPELLSPGDLLLANNTRVIHAALAGVRHAREGGQDVAVSATLHRRLPGAQRTAFLKPGRRVRTADTITFSPDLSAVVTEALDGGEYVLAFNQSDEALDALIERYGRMPLPPYIASKRVTDERDRSDYQTVYAERPGSVAAPTAGLHITEALRDRLAAAGIDWRTVTLHVNAGTFQPVKVDRLDDHRMHAEYAEMPAETAAAINATRARGGRCVAIGTTSLRTLESSAHGGVVRPFAAETSIFIRPGYRFQAADALLTNFHLPRSTLFILVCALAGATAMKRAYQHAIDRRYRFYSYGDACLILPHG